MKKNNMCGTNNINENKANSKVEATKVEMKVEMSETLREIKAEYDDKKEFVLDEKGYFLIRIEPTKKLIEVGFCREKNIIDVKISGTKPTEIYQTILREKLIDRADHAAYLGRELQKAYHALCLGVPYIQDDELDIAQLQKTEK